MSEKLERFEYLSRMGFDNTTDEQAELRFYFNSVESSAITSASRIAALEAQNARLVEALSEIYEYTSQRTIPNWDDEWHEKTRALLAEVTQ